MSEETEDAPWVLVLLAALVLVLEAAVVPAFCAEDMVAISWANMAAKVSFAEVVAWVDAAVFVAAV
jgi:Na+-transporting NADH:ubiquinone oxidoreductase subunit NqrB